MLVHFSAAWNGPCKQLQPIIDKIADDYQGKIKVGVLDIDESLETSKKYGITSVPTCTLFEGGARRGMITGLTMREELIQLLAV